MTQCVEHWLLVEVPLSGIHDDGGVDVVAGPVRTALERETKPSDNHYCIIIFSQRIETFPDIDRGPQTHLHVQSQVPVCPPDDPVVEVLEDVVEVLLATFPRAQHHLLLIERGVT